VIVIALYDIHGNFDALEAVPAGAPDDMPAVTAALSARELGAERARGLDELPLSLELDGVLYCHATPRSDEQLLTRLSPESRYAEALEGVDAGVVVAGHTHQQDDRRVGGVRFVNAGSVGLPYEGDCATRWRWVTDGVSELRRTPYDGAAAGHRMLEAGWPDERSVNAALISPVPAIEITRFFEQRA
jgi:predicted phosphodiesterase